MADTLDGQRRERSSATLGGAGESLACFQLRSLPSPATAIPRKKKKNKNQRRFSNDQIRSLEFIFESETKLEPRKKQQLASELGLQPRQVAIWFQNKRARWKSKQLERDYAILRNNYNSLLSQFDLLKQEKDSLILQLQKLNDAVNGGMEGQSIESGLTAAAAKAESQGAPEPGFKYVSFEDSADGPKVAVLSDNDEADDNYFGLKQEEEEVEPTALLSMVQEPVDGTLTSSAENWESLETPENILDHQSSTSYQWWDFWS